MDAAGAIRATIRAMVSGGQNPTLNNVVSVETYAMLNSPNSFCIVLNKVCSLSYLCQAMCRSNRADHMGKFPSVVLDNLVVVVNKHNTIDHLQCRCEAPGFSPAIVHVFDPLVEILELAVHRKTNPRWSHSLSPHPPTICVMFSEIFPKRFRLFVVHKVEDEFRKSRRNIFFSRISAKNIEQIEDNVPRWQISDLLLGVLGPGSCHVPRAQNPICGFSRGQDIPIREKQENHP